MPLTLATLQKVIAEQLPALREQQRRDFERITPLFAQLSRRSTMPATATILRQQAEFLLAEAKVLDAFGEDNFPDDAIITWEQRFHHSEPYTYVALKVEERGWYLTGRDGAHPLAWESLVASHLAKAEPDSIWFANRFERL